MFAEFLKVQQGCSDYQYKSRVAYYIFQVEWRVANLRVVFCNLSVDLEYSNQSLPVLSECPKAAVCITQKTQMERIFLAMVDKRRSVNKG